MRQLFCHIGYSTHKVYLTGRRNFRFGWLLGFYDSTRDKDDTTVGVGHSRRYCNTGYDQSQGRRPSTLKCIQGRINPVGGPGHS